MPHPSRRTMPMSSSRWRARVEDVNREFIVSPQKWFTKALRRRPDLAISELLNAPSLLSVRRLVDLRRPRRLRGGIGGGRAGEAHSFIVAANDGYGVQDCLGEGGECGHVVADAWCEAHGHGAALAFGRADDVTGAIRVAAPPAPTTPRPMSSPAAINPARASAHEIAAFRPARRPPPPRARSAPSRSSSSASPRSACPNRSYKPGCCA